MHDPSQTHVGIWGVVYESDVIPRVVSNFYQEFSVTSMQREQHSIPLYHSLVEEYSSPLVQSQAQVGIQFSPRENKLAVVLYKCRITVIEILAMTFDLHLFFLGHHSRRVQKLVPKDHIFPWKGAQVISLQDNKKSCSFGFF